MCCGTGICDVSQKKNTCVQSIRHTHVNVAVASGTVVQPDQPGVGGRTGVFNWLHLRGQAGAIPVCTEPNLDLNSS